ncbi:MAG: aminomethyl transferase family protein [Planctomycetes bacterium]|nr:aminomethyl transferase family protein [Planctomycetota bacterium]
MSETPTRQSPIHPWLEARKADWSFIGTTPIAFRLQEQETERAAMKTLGLCDLSALAKLGVKGPDAHGWLQDQQVDVPDGIYESRRLADGGVIVRLAPDEFLLEGGITNESLPALRGQMDSPHGQVVHIVREEATFLLIGARSLEVLAQTCGINFHEAGPRCLILTRVAGVSCGVFPDPIKEISAYRLWVDPSYAVYLWETLVEICESLGGHPIGAGCIFPELLE